MKHLPLPIIIPLAAVLFVILVAGGLGVFFIALNETSLGENGAILFGLLLVIGVPLIGALLVSRTRSQQDS